jgi:hypothetical protein
VAIAAEKEYLSEILGYDLAEEVYNLIGKVQRPGAVEN